MISYIIVFLAVACTDYVYTQYLTAVQHRRRWAACGWATAVTLSSSLAIIEYTMNHWLLIPALLGAFAGTWVGMPGSSDPDGSS